MRLTAHQPAYIPWLGLLAKMDDADLFCLFDVVPDESSGFSNRQRIKTQNGLQWLTVPVHRDLELPLKDVRIANDQQWQRKHWRAIELAYSKAPFFDEYAPGFRAMLMQPWEKLTDLDAVLLVYFREVFGIKTQMVRASEHNFDGRKSDLVLDMCEKLGASEYVFGPMGRAYVDLPAFEEAGIKVEFQSYEHPHYPQLHGSFAPAMGAIDLLFNVGGEKGLQVIRSGHATAQR